MDPKLSSFLKEMRSMDYADEKLSKNPPPNGITAAEIEAISSKAYEDAPKASEAPPLPPESVSYWQALVDPNTNLTYYWNSVTNEVSWTIPEGGVITLPVATEQAEAKEKELEEAFESYPYHTTIAAEFIKPVSTITTVTAATDKGTASPLLKSGKKRPQSSPGKPPEPDVAPSLKKSRLSSEEQQSSSSNASVPEDKPSVAPTVQTPPEDRMKVQVNNMVILLSKKLQSLQSSAPNSTQLETLAIQLQTRQTDWTEGGVSTKYMLEKLRKMNEDIFMLESSLIAGDQGLPSDNEGIASVVRSVSLLYAIVDGVRGEAVNPQLWVQRLSPANHPGRLNCPGNLSRNGTGRWRQNNPGYWRHRKGEQRGPLEGEQQHWPALEGEQHGPLEMEETEAVGPQVSQVADREGAVSQSTGEMECSASSSAAHYSKVTFPENLTEEESVDSPGPVPPEALSPNLPAAPGPTSEAKVEPETGMPEGEMASREEDDEEVGVSSKEAGHYCREPARGWWSRWEEEEPRESDTRDQERVDTYGVQDVASRVFNSEKNDSLDRMDYDRIVEDVTDKEEEDDDNSHKVSTRVQPQAVQEKEGVSSEEGEEEGVWVEPGKERSEGELLDDSSDSSDSDDDTSREDRKQDDKEKFGPREENSKKKKQADNYEKSEGELDQDSEDEKSEGELDDDKEEVWEEKKDYYIDRGSHSHRRHNYRPRAAAHDQDSDYSDYSSNRRDRRDHRHYESDYSDDQYSSRSNRHHHREQQHKNYNRSRDRYRDDSDYSDDYYNSSSRRHDRGRYGGDGYDQDHYKRSQYGGKYSSRSGKGYSGGGSGGGGGSSRYQRSRHSYDSDNDREHNRHRHHSSGKHRKRDRDKDKDRKKKQDYLSSLQNKDSDGEEKKPAASVLIGKVGKISTVRLLGMEKKADEGTEASKTGENTASTSASSSVPPVGGGAVGIPPPRPPATEMPAYQPMSATYYQHPSTGEVPYYPTYGTAYQYPAYSTAQTYQQQPPPPPQQQQAEVQEEEQKQPQEEGGWVWITNADGTPQWVRADGAAATSAKQKENDAEVEKEKKKQEEEGKSLEGQQEKWGDVNPAQWGGADPVQWASKHAPAPPPLPPEEPKPEEPRPPDTEQGVAETSTLSGDAVVAGGERMCSSNESFASGEQQQQQEAVSAADEQSVSAADEQSVSADGQLVQPSTLETTGDAQNEGVPSDHINQPGGAGSSFVAPPLDCIGKETSPAPPLPVSEPDVTDNGGQKVEEEIADYEMEIESNHGSPIAPSGANDTSGPTDAGPVPVRDDANLLPAGDLPVSANNQQATHGQETIPTYPVPPSSSAELTSANSTEVAQGDSSRVAIAATAVESSAEPAAQQSMDPSITSSEAVITQASTVAASSAMYYPSTAAAAPPPPVDAASYSYAAAYGQQAYNYAYPQGYNYAYMQPAAYGAAYGVQAGAPAYYPYPTPAAGVYGTYPQTYYGATSYSSVPAPATFQPAMSTVGAATSGVDNTTHLAVSSAKEKSTKKMLEQWTAFKEGEGKSS